MRLTRFGAALRVLTGVGIPYGCKDCGRYGFGYMLRNSLWKYATRGDDDILLCLQCVERRIGRPLARADFTDVPINAPLFYVFDRVVR